MVLLKSPSDIVRMRAANVIVAEVLAETQALVVPGVTTLELNRFAEERCLRKKAQPAFKGYRGYPFSLCTSVNNEVVHGMPSGRRLEAGDILSLDFGVLHRGFYGDAAVTVPVGAITDEARLLLDTTREALYKGIGKCRPGGRLFDISAAIQERAESRGVSVVRYFVGHGIGRSLHEKPQVPNYGVAGQGLQLRSGMVLAIEPMLNMGGSEVKILPDGWTAVTADGSLSAHFEHSVAITDDGCQVLSEL
ncbi:MAG: type I methionyl aminopeptidase [Pseudomonadota bacterium]